MDQQAADQALLHEHIASFAQVDIEPLFQCSNSYMSVSEFLSL